MDNPNSDDDLIADRIATLLRREREGRHYEAWPPHLCPNYYLHLAQLVCELLGIDPSSPASAFAHTSEEARRG